VICDQGLRSLIPQTAFALLSPLIPYSTNYKNNSKKRKSGDMGIWTPIYRYLSLLQPYQIVNHRTTVAVVGPTLVCVALRLTPYFSVVLIALMLKNTGAGNSSQVKLCPRTTIDIGDGLKKFRFFRDETHMFLVVFILSFFYAL
jgi:hypothetical protein